MESQRWRKAAKSNGGGAGVAQVEKCWAGGCMRVEACAWALTHRLIGTRLVPIKATRGVEARRRAHAFEDVYWSSNLA